MSRELSSQVQGRMQALVGTLPQGFDGDRLDQLLLTVGDGLRLACVVPRPLVRWLEGRTQSERAESLLRFRRSLERGRLSTSSEPDERLELVVLARDRAASVLVATRRLERGDAWEAPGFAELDEVCAAFDAQVERFGREAVERALGPRAEMLGPGHWASCLPDRAQTTDEGAADIPRGEGRPSDEAIRTFVEDGRHYRTVLGLAEADPTFAEELEELLSAMRTSGEHLGLAARRWARERLSIVSTSFSTSAATLGTTVPLPLGLKRVAADTARDEAVLEDLGHLVPIEARAHLVAHRGHVVLELQADEALTQVELGGVAATREGALWTARAPYARELALVVRAPDGRAFEVTLDLEGDV